MHRQVLQVRRRVLGEEHPDTLNSKNNLANAVEFQGKCQEAEKMHREVLEVRSRVLREEHPNTLNSKNNLANAVEFQGKWQEAEKMHREVLEARRRVLGEDHPETLTSMANLASAVALRDESDWRFRYSLDNDAHFERLRDAIHKLRTSIAAQELRGDDKHPDLLKCRMYLAELLVQKNQESELEEAEALLLQTVPALPKRYGFNHALTSRATSHLVFLLEEQGKDAEEWRQHLPHVEENDVAISQEGLEDCEDLQTAEMLRYLLAKPRLQVAKVYRSSASGSTPAAAQDAASAPTSLIAPSQLFQVVSEAASRSGYVSDARSSDTRSSAWWEAALQQQLHERKERELRR